MSIQAYTCNGKCVGLKVDNFNLSKRMIKNLNIDCSKLSSVECTSRFHEFLNENGEIIRWNTLKDIREFVRILILLNEYNIKVEKDFFLKPITKKYLNDIASKTVISSYWRSHLIRGTRVIISPEGKIVGLISYLVESDDSIYLAMIEIFDKNSGYGTKIVNELLSICNKGIRGISYDSALGFWSKFGAKIDYTDNHFSISKM